MSIFPCFSRFSTAGKEYHVEFLPSRLDSLLRSVWIRKIIKISITVKKIRRTEKVWLNLYS